MKKISLIKKIFLMIIFLLATSLVSVSAASYPSKITVGKLTWLDDYLGYEVDFNYKQTSDGRVIYCLEYPKDVPSQGMELSYNSVADAGLTYIIKNGYPNKKITGDNNKDYYVTQVAIWLYLNQSTTGLNLIKQDMNSKSGIMYTTLKSLVDGANKAKTSGYAVSSLKLNINNNKLTLSNDGKYYVSQQFGVTSSNITGNYNVTLKNAPKGTLIQTIDGKNSTDFTSSSKFIVKVPASSINSLSSSFTVNVNATGSIDKTYIYSTGNSKYQKMILAGTYPVTNSLNDNGNIVINTDKVIINKIDSETGKNIAGATLAIKNEKGTKVLEWVTTTDSKVINNLPVGKYTLYEVKAPNGYEKTNKTQSFSITNSGKEIKLTVANNAIENDKVIINKTDSETGKNIAGATLAIKNEKGTKVLEWVTTTDSKVINNLPVGKYTLYEVKAPNGYEKTDKVYPFEIVNKGKEIKLTVVNVELVHTAQVEISKQDVTTSKELPGAKLTIKDSKGKVIETWVSTDKPHYLTLEVGKYTLIEEIAPKGYVLSKEEITFEITKDTKDIVKKVMYNTPEPTPEPEEIVVEVPKTDVNSSLFYGLTASISALGYGLMKKFGRK